MITIFGRLIVKVLILTIPSAVAALDSIGRKTVAADDGEVTFDDDEEDEEDDADDYDDDSHDPFEDDDDD